MCIRDRDISSWDVSSVENMTNMFRSTSGFNNGGVTLNWNDKTSNVTTMQTMFYQASGFNQDISNWNVSSVTSCDLFSQYSGLDNAYIPTFTNCSP